MEGGGISGGARKKKTPSKKAPRKPRVSKSSIKHKSSHKMSHKASHKTSHKSSRSSHKSSYSRYTHSRSGVGQTLPNKASKDMPLSILQILAKRRGIPFGGLNKTKLIHKINTY